MVPRILAIATICIALSVSTVPVGTDSAHSGGIHIIVTFSFMLEDVKGILCEGDEVQSLVPPGIDPHEYQLTPQDLEILSRADLVVSTGHTPFEMRIKELVSEGLLKARLVEVPKISGVKFLVNPSTGVTNYHGLLMDFDNYVVFVQNVSSTLSVVRPSCSAVYINRAEDVVNKVKGIAAKKVLENYVAVVDSPMLQYLLTALGADVKHVVEVEHDVPLAPNNIVRAEEILKNYGGRAIVVVLQGSRVGITLRDYAQRYSVPIIALPSPLGYSSTFRYIELSLELIAHHLELSPTSVPYTLASAGIEGYLTYIAVGLVILLISVALLLIVMKR